MLKIKDGVDLKVLEKFGFIPYTETKLRHDSRYNPISSFLTKEEKCYTETGYRWDNGTNTIEVVEKRVNSDWIHPDKELDIYVYESDWERGVSMDAYDVIFDLINNGLVEKYVEDCE